MDVGEDEDEFLTNIDYSSHYALEHDQECVNDDHDVAKGLKNVERDGTISNYFSLNKLNDVLRTKSEGDLFVLHINAVSLVVYFDEIKSLISAKISDISLLDTGRN